jgi:hypothetical protein
MGSVDPILVAKCVTTRRVTTDLAPHGGGITKPKGGASGFRLGARYEVRTGRPGAATIFPKCACLIFGGGRIINVHLHR